MDRRSEKKSQPPPLARQTGAQRLRIVGGRWRGVRVDFPDVAAIRPSPDRVRETLFNWLQQSVHGARCLDLFAGSGALGLEALSRGASAVTFVDSESRVTRHLQQVLKRLQTEDATVVCMPAQRFLAGTAMPFDLVFLDPPFGAQLLQPSIDALAAGWLAAPGWVYVECGVDESLPTLPPGWVVHRTGRAGQVGYHLLRSN